MSPSITLEPIEGRVLGVLVEKSLTTPEQYPLSLNALTAGCNQKSNRHPVMGLGEHEVEQALMRLRVAQLVEFVRAATSRVERYQHRARPILDLDEGQVAVLAELLLRGAQTKGELRQRASRMHPMPTLDDLERIGRPLVERGLVIVVPPEPGSRASRYGQTLCPDADTARAAGLDAEAGADTVARQSGWTTPPAAARSGGAEAQQGGTATMDPAAPAATQAWPRSAPAAGGASSAAATGPSAATSPSGAGATAPGATRAAPADTAAGARSTAVEARLAALEAQVARLAERLARLEEER